MNRYISLLCVTVAGMVFGPALAGQKPAAKTVPKYTVIPVVLDDTISSVKNKTGDKFEVHCVGPNCGGFPSGTTFIGVLTITRAQGEKPATGSAKFVSAVLPDERKIQIQAVPSTADGVKIESKTAGTTKKETRRKVGALGAGIGALTDGFKGAVVGGAIGAAAGSAAKSKGKEGEIKAGTKGYIMLTKLATIPPPKGK